MRPGERTLTERHERGRRQHGDRYDGSALDGVDESIKAAYRSGDRVRVRSTYADGSSWERTGVVSTTSGWVPAFMLMHRSNSHGSWDLLDERDRVVARWNGRKYVEVPDG